MKMTATVDGVVHDVKEGGLADLVAFERHFGIPASVLDPDDPTPGRVEWIAFSVWRALRTAKVFAPEVTFDEAIDRIEDLNQVLEPGDDGYEADGADAIAVDPTPEAASVSALPVS